MVQDSTVAVNTGRSSRTGLDSISLRGLVAFLLPPHRLLLHPRFVKVNQKSSVSMAIKDLGSLSTYRISNLQA